MFKKSLILGLAALAATQVNAFDLLNSEITPSCWNASYEASTHTITYESGQWGGCSWWLGGEDYSQYSSIEVVLAEPSTVALSVIANYSSDGSDNGSQSFPAGTTTLTLDLDQQKSQTLYGMYIANNEAVEGGVDVKLASIDIKAASTPSTPPTSTSVTVWSGSTELGNWENFVMVEADKFSSVKAGDVLNINITELSSESEYHQIILKTTAENWPTLSGCDYETIQQTGNFSLTVTDAIAQELKATGLIVAGCYVTLSEISLSSSQSQDPQTTAVSVWNGSSELGNWENFIMVEADKFSSVKAGDVVKINISELSTESEYHQIILKTSAENWPTLTGCDYETIAATGEFSLNVTDAIAQELKATGLIVVGCYVTISEISIESTSSTEPGGNTPSQTQTFQWSAEALALDILENGASNKANIEISMSNLKPAIGFQCDITVPEAIISAIGTPTWASRSLDSHVISYSTLANGDIRIVAFSNSNEAFTGESGVLFCLPFNSANLTAGVYTIKIHESCVNI